MKNQMAPTIEFSSPNPMNPFTNPDNMTAGDAASKDQNNARRAE
jgi:hypothetical protein